MLKPDKPQGLGFRVCRILPSTVQGFGVYHDSDATAVVEVTCCCQAAKSDRKPHSKPGLEATLNPTKAANPKTLNYGLLRNYFFIFVYLKPKRILKILSLLWF